MASAKATLHKNTCSSIEQMKKITTQISDQNYPSSPTVELHLTLDKHCMLARAYTPQRP